MDRYERLAPASLIASISSMPRRWKEAVYVPPDVSIDDFFTVSTDQGSIAEHFGAAIAQIALLRDAIRTTSYNVPEPLDMGVAAAVANKGSGPWPKNAKSARNELKDQFEKLEGELKELKTTDWNRSADAGNTTLTILALAQGASRVGAERLSIVERLVRSLADEDHSTNPPPQDQILD